MRHRCRCAVSRITRIRLFPLFFHNGCSQSSRFPTAGQGERSSGNEIDVHWASRILGWSSRRLSMTSCNVMLDLYCVSECKITQCTLPQAVHYSLTVMDGLLVEIVAHYVCLDFDGYHAFRYFFFFKMFIYRSNIIITNGIIDVIYQKRVRVFHQGFQTPRN